MSEGRVIAACDALVDFHAWDPTKIDARGWLANFDVADRPLAEALLSRFSFYSDHLVDQLFRAAFQNISNLIQPGWRPFGEAQARWRDFCANALVTLVQGEEPNPSDSGWLFARKARQIIGVSEAQLVTPAQAVERVALGHAESVVFVDDFVGSGEQFLKTWDRNYSTGQFGDLSFRQTASANGQTRFFYCNAMTTARGLQRIASAVPNVQVSAGNVIPQDHSLSSPRSALWRAEQLNDGIEMIRRLSFSLGFTDSSGSLNDWEGFHKLGLGLAFEHSVPDATLPIFYTDRSGWIPLVRRS